MGLKDKIIMFLDKAIRWLIVILPFSIAIETAPVNIVWSMLLVVYIAKGIISPPKGTFYTSLNLFFGLFIISSSVSLLNSLDSVRGIEIGLRNLFLLIRYWLLIIVMAKQIKSKSLMRKIILAMVLGGLLSSVDSFWQLFSGRDFMRGIPPVINIGLVRATASFANANVLGVYVTPLFVISAGLTRYYFVNREKFFMAILSFVLLLCVLLTYSRFAILACFIGLFLIALVKRDKLLIAIFAIIILISPLLMPKSVKDWAKSVNYNPIIFLCNQDRISIYRNAVNMIKHHPIIGVGLGTFSDNYLKYKLPEPANARTADHVYAHNNFLQMAGEIGLLGLGVFILLMIKIFRIAFINHKLLQDKFYKILNLCLTASLVAFFINGLTETSLYYKRVAVIFWFIMGLVMALSKIKDADTSEQG